jgi:hypothetical protein
MASSGDGTLQKPKSQNWLPGRHSLHPAGNEDA